MHAVDAYIQAAPKETQDRLKLIRALIIEVAPEAEEGISYGMPGYKINKKPLVYFVVFKEHIGLYATPSAHKKFEKELSTYKQGKGSVQFPLNEPFPMKLISDIVRFKMEEILHKK